MTNKWIHRFMALARHISTWSQDPSTKVGAVIVNDDKRVLSMGYNDLTMGLDDKHPKLRERPLKYKVTEHAERNACYSAARLGISLMGTTIVSTLFPCSSCARAIVQSGIARLVAPEPDWDHERWGEDFRIASRILQKAGTTIIFYKENKHDKS